jgi:hypothetical protein
MSQIFTIEHDKVVIKKLALETLEGDLSVSGTLTVDNLVVLNAPEDDTTSSKELGKWAVNDEADLLGKEFSWTWGHGSVQLGYRPGNRLWTNSDLDLERGKSFMVDGVAVLSANELSSQVTKSRLKEVGTLKSLNVSGDTALGEFAVFNSSLNRLGLNTEEPNGTLSVVDNNVEFVINSPRDNIIEVGTYTNSDLHIVTDNTSRVVLKNNGEVIFGNPATNNANVKIYGTLHVETVVADNRLDRYASLEFKSSREQSIFGQGLLWTGTGNMRQLVMRTGPERLYTTEAFDIGTDQSYHIGGTPVLSTVGLGTTVTQSNLSKLGTLDELNVDGEATFLSRINASRAILNAKTILFNDGQEFTITNSKLSASNNMSFNVSEDEIFYADLKEIAIGNKQNVHRPVKIFGKLSVGVNSVTDDVDLTVKGDVRIANKKFVTGTSVPVQGLFAKGDICWNQTPVADNYVGWICIEDGSPGQWLPFGAIARQ